MNASEMKRHSKTCAAFGRTILVLEGFCTCGATPKPVPATEQLVSLLQELGLQNKRLREEERNAVMNAAKTLLEYREYFGDLNGNPDHTRGD